MRVESRSVRCVLGGLGLDSFRGELGRLDRRPDVETWCQEVSDNTCVRSHSYSAFRIDCCIVFRSDINNHGIGISFIPSSFPSLLGGGFAGLPRIGLLPSAELELALNLLMFLVPPADWKVVLSTDVYVAMASFLLLSSTQVAQMSLARNVTHMSTIVVSVMFPQPLIRVSEMFVVISTLVRGVPAALWPFPVSRFLVKSLRRGLPSCGTILALSLPLWLKSTPTKV